VIHAQHGQRIVDLAAALHAHQAGDLAGFLDAADVGGGAGQFEILRIFRHESAHDVDLLDRLLHRCRAGNGGRHIHAPELPAHAALMQAGDIGHQRPFEGAAVSLQVLAPPALTETAAQRARIVIMAIDDRLPLQHGLRAFQHGIVQRQGRGGGQQADEQQSGFHGRSVTPRRPLLQDR
jgi:hypothetical protein